MCVCVCGLQGRKKERLGFLFVFWGFFGGLFSHLCQATERLNRSSCLEDKCRAVSGICRIDTEQSAGKNIDLNRLANFRLTCFEIHRETHWS